MFPLDYSEIISKIDQIEPREYARSRNYIDGHVSMLSPYVSRGLISTRSVMNRLFERGFVFSECEKFIQELAWRDYWQQVWIVKQHEINQDLKQEQPEVGNYQMPKNIINASTGISAIDQAIIKFYKTGYLHNHVRMYIGALCCNNGKSHWRIPAQWMYYHLNDADWASNALSWQWVAGSNSNKKYIANQENINRYCHTSDTNTFLDLSYEEITAMAVPSKLSEQALPDLNTNFIEKLRFPKLALNNNLSTLIYNFYNIDPLWFQNQKVNRVFLIEPSIFRQYPISEKNFQFAIDLAQKNIEGLQFFIGEFSELLGQVNLDKIHYKEHPLNEYSGNEMNREWMCEVKGYYPSFFTFWKKAKKELR